MNNAYVPTPVNTKDVTLSTDLLELTEKIAENVHDVWAAGRIADGWTYGPERNDAEKKQKIMEIIAAKQDESLHNASVEELQAMLENLGQ